MTAAVGIVLYNPDIDRLKLNIQSVCRDAGHIYLCDNGSDNIADVREQFLDFGNVTFIENGKNLGIAAALNILCQNAKNDGYSHILTLDQDSVCGDGMLKLLMLYADNGEYGIIAPKEINEGEEVPEVKGVICEQYRVITSGSLTSLAAWEKVGGFDEALFIDLVDHDFCANLRLNGYKIMMVSAALLYHRLGETKKILFFKKTLGWLPVKAFKAPLYTHNHSPFRTYYYARNSFYFINKYKGTGAIDVRTERRVLLRWFVLKIGFEKERLSKLKAIIKGVRDSKRMPRREGE